MALVNKTSPKGSNPHFVESKKAEANVKVSPGKGGVNIGTLKHCGSKRAHSNVKSY
jgi:hypothetical protein